MSLSKRGEIIVCLLLLTAATRWQCCQWVLTYKSCLRNKRVAVRVPRCLEPKLFRRKSSFIDYHTIVASLYHLLYGMVSLAFELLHEHKIMFPVYVSESCGNLLRLLKTPSGSFLGCCQFHRWCMDRWPGFQGDFIIATWKHGQFT